VKRVAGIWIVAIGLCAGLLPLAEEATAQSDSSSAAAVSPKEALAAVPAGEPAGSAQAETEQSVSMFPIKGDKPLSIRSDELEALEEEGRRRLIFTRNVNVEQGDLQVHSDRLEALYPPGGSQPDRLVANGHVRVSQRDKTMLCDKATFYQSEDRLVCTGNAELLQGKDRVQGREIEIFVRQNRVKVKGGAIVNVVPASSGPSSTRAVSSPAPKATP
jgi:lipopolysaccharide export system protein LptA